MKKTFNINVAGFPFVIDEDAYTLLNDYLNTIEHAFRHVDGSAELINDIESRVAELLLERTEQGSAIITLSDVEQVIARVGKPEEFADDETITIEDGNGESVNINVETESATPPPYIPPLPKSVKRLYRDPQNAMLGGVCSGLAWYLGWDVTWVRLLVVLLTICSYSVMGIVYLVLWIVVPEARTPLQRMQMMGEQPTMENIGRTVTDTFREDQGEQVNSQPSAAPRGANILANGMGLLARAVVICGLIIGIPILLTLALGLIGCVLFLLAWGTTLIFGMGMPFQDAEFCHGQVANIVFWGVICGIGWTLTLGIPLLWGVRRGLNYTPWTKQTKRLLNIIWVGGFIIAGMATGMVIASAFENERQERERWRERHREYVEKVTVETVETDSILIEQDSLSITSGSDTTKVAIANLRIP